ncbi:pectate lyase [Actinomadura sp. CNU-125]|uniref:pectate lyase family protein n=1 Tax=Actinomadura sp. CNU-125 TaxID=1904961 RepID=UPI0009591B0C|nr:pectate lyase [Actinomadura sp. CNU-125]OLT38020.1 pectate lyase [Actinomadura sp. CNU-125]
MRRTRSLPVAVAAACGIALLAPAAEAHGPGRATLPAGDGWGAGTTGGAAARPDRVFTVRDRAQLVAALATGSDPKIIYVKGTIHGNVDDRNVPLTCDDYATGGYGLPAYLEAYDPDTWGWENEPSGPLEEARRASQQKQAERVEISVPSNTTIVGVGRHARLDGVSLQVENADNVIVRDLTFEDAADCFPAWDPTDGDTGAWNSEYDNLVLSGSTRVWVDHNTFTDGDNPDSGLPTYFGALYQVHDGQLDVVRGADLVTASWNVFTNHDKTLLIGNSDNAAETDAGKLRVTLHHNWFDGVIQRAPRVRFGRVDVYNNHYTVPSEGYEYSLGVGKESAIVAEHNSMSLPEDVPASSIIANWRGTDIRTSGNLVDHRPVDLLAAHNAAHEPDLGPDVGWTPTLRRTVHPAWAVRYLVPVLAGAGRLH